MPGVLQEELEFYQKVKPGLLEHHEGKYALIHDHEFINSFTTEAEAYTAGVNMFGREPFLIVRVTEKEDIEYFPALTLGVLRASIQ